MDIQKLISQVLSSLTTDSGLLEKFKKNPLETVQGLLGSLNLNKETLETIISGVTAKLNLDDTLKDAKGMLDSLGGLFGK